MPRNMPHRDLEALHWLEARIDAWSQDPAAIGLSPAATTQLAQDIADARDAFTDLENVRAKAVSATATFHGKGSSMRTQASAMIATIKSFAQTSATPQSVYDAASVSPRAAPSPSAPPRTPHNLKIHLRNDGGVMLAFDGVGPVGTLYEIYRRLPGENRFSLLANASARDKSYTDMTLPVGATRATYQIRAVRGELASPFSTQFNVQFGTHKAPAQQTSHAADQHPRLNAA